MMDAATSRTAPITVNTKWNQLQLNCLATATEVVAAQAAYLGQVVEVGIEAMTVLVNRVTVHRTHMAHRHDDNPKGLIANSHGRIMPETGTVGSSGRESGSRAGSPSWPCSGRIRLLPIRSVLRTLRDQRIRPTRSRTPSTA